MVFDDLKKVVETCKAEMDPYDLCTTEEFISNLQKKFLKSYEISLNQMLPNQESGRDVMHSLMATQFSMYGRILYDRTVSYGWIYGVLNPAFEKCKAEMDPYDLCTMQEFKLKLHKMCLKSCDIALNAMFPDQQKAREAISNLLTTQFALFDIAFQDVEYEFQFQDINLEDEYKKIWRDKPQI